MARRRRLPIGTRMVQCPVQQKFCPVGLAARQGLKAVIIYPEPLGGVPCDTKNSLTNPPFERTSKRRRGYPSETHVKRGRRVVHGDKELFEKLGRNDLCPCGSGRRFQKVLHAVGRIRR